MARDSDKRIVVEDSGPYQVYGDVPLVRKAQVVSEHGEPLTWQKGETLETAPQKDIEPDLPPEIAVTTEGTSAGPIPGPLWVTGSIPVERADGEPFETRNRVMLCRCGRSQGKPLGDGTHRPKE